MSRREHESLGEPDLQISGLRIWVHGRQFADSTDYSDGNWLRVTAYCEYPGSSVRASGSIIHLGEIVGLLRGCEQLHETLQGEAALACLEPNLRAELTAESGGRIAVVLNITPDHLTESHEFRDGFDQTYLPPIISACRTLLEKFPVRVAQNLPA